MRLSCKALAFCAISAVGIALATGITPAPGGTTPAQPLVVSKDFFQGPGQYGGTLYEVLGGAPDSFNIYGTVSPRTYTVMMHNVLSSLIRENPVTGALRPGLLTSWDVSNNGLIYTLHLRKGVRWSDGTPLTAGDVIFTMRCAQENPVARGNNVASFTLNGKLVDFTSPNPETVVAHLAKPNGGFPHRTSFKVPASTAVPCMRS